MTEETCGSITEDCSTIMQGTEADKAADYANYFCSYAMLYHQKQMLMDHVRMRAYHDAIMANKSLFEGKIILDVGTGSGVLSIWAAQAGAAKVFAIEFTEMAMHARALVEANGMSDIVEVIQSSVEDINLPCQVDIIISEWMGYFLLRESMLDSVIRARNKWMKPGGSMFPSTATMLLGCISNEQDREGKFDDYSQSMHEWHMFKQEMQEFYQVDMNILEPKFTKEQEDYYIYSSLWTELSQEHVIGQPVVVKRLDLNTCALEDALGVAPTEYRFDVPYPVRASGFAGWFTVDFAGSVENPAEKRVTLSTGPEMGYTHWGQQIESERDAMALEGVGPALAREIMKARQNHTVQCVATDADSRTQDSADIRVGAVTDCSKYKPCHGRGPWAILCALHFLQGYQDKAGILDCMRLQSINVHVSCDVSNTIVWSRSIKSLKEKGILEERIDDNGKSRSVRYGLTASGAVVAARLYSEEKDMLVRLSANRTSSELRTEDVLNVRVTTRSGVEISAPIDLTCESFPQAPRSTIFTCGGGGRERTVLVLSDSDDTDLTGEIAGDTCDIRHDSLNEQRGGNGRGSTDSFHVNIPLRQRLAMKRGDTSAHGCRGSEAAVVVEDVRDRDAHLANPSFMAGEGPLEDSPRPFQATGQEPKRCRGIDCPLFGGKSRSVAPKVSTSSYPGSVSRGVGSSGNTQTFVMSNPSAAAGPTPRQTPNLAAASYVDPLAPTPAETLLQSGDWEVVLLVDKREKEYSFFESFMLDRGIRVEVCQLALGDYMWVAKRRASTESEDISRCVFSLMDDSEDSGYSSSGSARSDTMIGSRKKKKGSAKQQREDLQREVVVLDCIVERKTVLDLASSIVDGRYEEQKQRLSSCGVQHVVYLVEGVSLNPQGLGRGGLRATHSRGGAGRTGGGGGRSGAEGQRGGGITSATILTAMASTQAMDVAVGMCRAPLPPSHGQSDVCAEDSDVEDLAVTDANTARPTEGNVEAKASVHVVNTRGLDHTAFHLLCLHRRVEARFDKLKERCRRLVSNISSSSSSSSSSGRQVHSKLQSLWEFQARSSRNQRVSTIGQLHVAQLRQVRGCSVSAASAISKRFGGTMLNMHTHMYSKAPIAVQDRICEVNKVGPTGKHSRIGSSLAKVITDFMLR